MTLQAGSWRAAAHPGFWPPPLRLRPCSSRGGDACPGHLPPAQTPALRSAPALRAPGSITRCARRAPKTVGWGASGAPQGTCQEDSPPPSPPKPFSHRDQAQEIGGPDPSANLSPSSPQLRAPLPRAFLRNLHQDVTFGRRESDFKGKTRRTRTTASAP